MMKPSKISVVFLYSSFAIVIIHLVVLSIIFNKIPETVPTHYSGSNPDAFGPKYTLWLEPIISTIILLLISFCIFKMKKPNSLDSYLENSEEEAIKNRQLLLSVLALIATLIISAISFISLLEAR
ncbi:MAG: DUF1648 domain-containing protein [Chryseobacterium sp.]|nr:DUF1648 domain-containing protein [Candidatus Chryseobacterium enterohippi]